MARWSKSPTPTEPLTSEQLKAKAVRLLALRDHTRLELSRKLAPFASDLNDVERVLDQLQASGWQSDARVAISICRVKSQKQGSALIAQAMRQKGLSAALIDEAVVALKDTELARARVVWEKKFGQPATDAKDKARQMRFLASRGFSTDVIYRVVGADQGEEL
jgi:regulatory protein